MPGIRKQPRASSAPGTFGGFVLLYVALGFAGRATSIDGTTFALIWPAGGVAVLWFLVRDVRLLSVDTLVLAGCVLGVNLVTGAPFDVGLVLIVTTVLQTVVAATLMRRWCPRLWGCGGDRALDSPRILARYVAAAVVAAAAGAVVGAAAFAVIYSDLAAMGGLLWFGRNLGSVLTLTTLGLLLGHRLSTPAPRPPLVGVGAASGLELAAGVLLTLGLFGLAFVFADLPLAFPLIASTAWVALRFPTLLSAVHSMSIGAATVALTLFGHGPFARVDNPELGALIAQFYVMTIVVTALALSTGRDEREELALELRRSQSAAVYESRLRDAIIGSMTEGLVVMDDTGEVLVLNDAAGEIVGRPETLIEGFSLYGLAATHPDGSPILDQERPSLRALRGETVHDMEVLVVLPTGVSRILSISAMPLPPDALTGRSRALMLARDTTDEHARREELSAFAGVVAHDLRNPLAAIDGWTEMIADELDAGELQPELAREFVSRVRSASHRMRELIRDLLAHATSGARDLNLARVDVSGLVAEVVAARHAGDRVTWGRIPCVEADPVLVRQVLDNLLGNALKYVAADREPRITVTGLCSQHLVTIRVTDNGIGLPAGEHEKIFEEFHRAHYQEYEGSGLGLSICRRIVTRHGGTIVARDNPEGPGTVFEFTLPAAEHVEVPLPVEEQISRSA
ncbi:MAG: sensor protein [Nocardioides sp.]|nr:sensor protein [Nocardioides sp.]